MKKIISIILGFCIAFSCVSAGAMTASQSQIESLMKALSIMNGDEKGNLNLGDAVTRAEFSKVAVASSPYRSDVSSVSRVSPFSDVPFTYWGATYIRTAADYGLVKGYTDSTFKPEDTVLLEEGVTIALKLLGYTDSDFTATWPSGQLNKAKQLKMLDNLNNKNQGARMSRHDVMYLIYNTLNTQMKNSNSKLIESVFGYSLASNGDIENIVMDNAEIEGPVTINSININTIKNAVSSSAKYYRNDKAASAYDMTVNDIVYYSEKLDTVWMYSDKILGVYEKATPSKDNLTGVTVTGVSYNIETNEAFSKLATGGEFEYGDSILLLLGKNGEVADVLSAKTQTTTIYGYVTGTGTKFYEYSTGEKYSSYYVSVMSADGTTYEYKTEKDYKANLSAINKVQIKDGYATLTKVTGNSLEGEVSAENYTIGTRKLSQNVKILDVMITDKEKTPMAKQIYISRLDGLNLKQSDVLHYTADSNGNIENIFLNDVTGDGYSYGVITDVTTNKTYITSFVLDVKGQQMTLNGNYKSSLKVGDAVKIITGSRGVESISGLIKINDTVTDIDYSYVHAGGKKYSISEDVAVYSKNGDNYTLMKFSDVMGLSGKNISAYMSNSSLDKVRVIITE